MDPCGVCAHDPLHSGLHGRWLIAASTLIRSIRLILLSAIRVIPFSYLMFWFLKDVCIITPVRHSC